MMAGILGTLKAGGAYVPMDPAYPKDRIAFMLNDAKAGVLLTQRKQLSGLPETDARLICLDEFDWECSSHKSLPHTESQRQNGSHQSPLAYVIYTSGSTGMPKGVAIEHRNAVAFVSWAKDVFTPEQLSGVLASTSICFDLSVFEMFVPLCCGGKVILAENALALPGLPAAKEVKLINTVPSAIRELLRLKGVPESVQVVNLAGEPLATSLVNDIYSQSKVRKVYDLYGPTETTTYSTFTLRKFDEPPSIGRPLSNEQVYLLGPNMQPVPIGVPGDLYIGGDGVARGYLNRPELTAEKFIGNPFARQSSGNGAVQRLYKTGDLARWRADGRLEFLGRRDHQVKIRGFRIELGEIETVLNRVSVMPLFLLAKISPALSASSLTSHLPTVTSTPGNCEKG
jgi:amino acid adenylation domain-containing protein